MRAAESLPTQRSLSPRVGASAVLMGMAITLVATMPRNILFALNLRYVAGLPWAVPFVAIYLWFVWRYLRGDGPPNSTRELRRQLLRANPVSGIVWMWAMCAGTTAIVALVLGLRVANRLVRLPSQHLPDVSHVPCTTVVALLLASAPIAAVIEESAFRGYMQGPLEQSYGLTLAILITGTMFAIAHLDFALVLWPYYLGVAAIYGVIAHRTGSILPTMVLHTLGNTFSNLDLWLHRQAEWQTPAGSPGFVWISGADANFYLAAAAFIVATAASLWCFAKLSMVTKSTPTVR